MAIYIKPIIISNMLEQAVVSYPEESCGIIVGTFSSQEISLGSNYCRCTNEKSTFKERRFLIDPTAYQTIEDQADLEGLSIISIVHSHPDHPDEPSEFDKEHAWPGLSYIIISVIEGSVKGYRSWRLSDDRMHFDQENILIETP